MSVCVTGVAKTAAVAAAPDRRGQAAFSPFEDWMLFLGQNVSKSLWLIGKTEHTKTLNR